MSSGSPSLQELLALGLSNLVGAVLVAESFFMCALQNASVDPYVKPLPNLCAQER